MVTLGSFGVLNCGCPSLLVLGGVADSESGIELSFESFSSDVIIMDCGSGFLGFVLAVAPENGNGCREHTSLVSTATDLSMAQKS